jgi:Hypothetical protein (DUF2513)
MDLIRKILLAIEAHTKPGDWVKLNIDGYAEEQIAYHVKLLAQANLVEANDVSSSSGFEWKAQNLTREGHEFLEASRDEGRWKKAKTLLMEKAGSLSYEILKEVLLGMMKGAVSL